MIDRQEIFDEVERIWELCEERNIGSNETELDQRETITDYIVEKLNLARVSVSTYRDELLKKADDMKESGKRWHTNEVYIEGLDCALDNMKDHITKLANKH